MRKANLIAVLALLLGQASMGEPLSAQSPTPESAILQSVLEYVRPHLPPGRIAVNFDYKYGRRVDDRIEWHRPYKMPAAPLHAPVLQIVDARPFSPEHMVWCEPGRTDAPAGCMSAMLIVVAPEIHGESAEARVLWKTDQGETETQFEFDLQQSGGRWEIVKERHWTRYH